MKVVAFHVTTDSSGDYTATANPMPEGVYLLYAVEWVDGTFDNNVTGVLSATNTQSGVAKTLFSLAAGEADDDAWFYPRVVAHDEGAEALASGADVTAEYAMQVVAGQLKLVVAAGGNTKSGKCLVYLKEM